MYNYPRNTQIPANSGELLYKSTPSAQIRNWKHYPSLHEEHQLSGFNHSSSGSTFCHPCWSFNDLRGTMYLGQRKAGGLLIFLYTAPEPPSTTVETLVQFASAAARIRLGSYRSIDVFVACGPSCKGISDTVFLVYPPLVVDDGPTRDTSG